MKTVFAKLGRSLQAKVLPQRTDPTAASRHACCGARPLDQVDAAPILAHRYDQNEEDAVDKVYDILEPLNPEDILNGAQDRKVKQYARAESDAVARIESF